jgi:hypothetical protein
MPEFPLDQETDRPASGDPFWAIGVAVSCWVPSTNSDAEPGLTPTAATGTSETVIADVPVCPSLVAEIVGLPGRSAVTSPVELTIATSGLLVDQETGRPVSGAPFSAVGVAVSCWVPPTNSDADPGLTATEATGMSVTVMVEVPVWPSLVAEIIAVPGATAVTRPVELTVAAPALLLDQETDLSVSCVPFCAVGVAVSC